MTDRTGATAKVSSFALLTGGPDGPVEIVLSDQPDLDQSETWLKGRVVVSCTERVTFAALRIAALRELRTLVGDEIQRLERLRDDSAE
ncbi:hypothetical protein [Hyphomonas sp. L-53-1-40]|uniref:hypothetical protein n=1 Tax=Hyphomonas sp. L-53-1-40 TaxID=1207058 RepID=UPI0012EC945B|nr:hypothetical protein [Hyphomonas sp. L-53-1-40]